MCIFSGRVDDVSSTRIFCTTLTGGRQATVYQMQADIPGEVAMILPVPVKPDTDLEFVNLENYPNFFRDMDRLFDSPDKSRGRGVGVASAGGKLPVVDVGLYEASFVPNFASFLKLDERFRLASDLWQWLPDYSGFAFVVFQLKKAPGKRQYHPMAYKFTPQNPREMFFPTTHVHNGAVPSKADYDHKLYYQHSDLFGAGSASVFTSQTYRTADYMKLDLAEGLLTERPISRLAISGHLPNQDHIFTTGVSVRHNALR